MIQRDLTRTAPQGFGKTAWINLALVVILLGAAALRLAGLDAGLPLVLNGDEVTVVERALALRWNDLNPHVFMYGSLPFYLLKGTTFFAGLVSSATRSAAPTLPDYYLLSRCVSAVFGIATVYLAFVLGRLLNDAMTGLLSAALFAVSPLAVDLSHYATVDSMLGFWCALALVGMAMWMRQDRRGMYIAGVAAGLAMSTKYNAVLLLVPIFLIAAQAELAKPLVQPSRSRRIVVVITVLLGAFLYAIVVIKREWILNYVAHWSTSGQLQAVYVQIFDRMLLLLFIGSAAGCGVALGVIANWSWANKIVHLLTGRLFLVPTILAVLSFALTSPFVLFDLPASTRDFFFQLNKNISGGVVGYAPGSRTYLAALGDSTVVNSLQYIQAIQDEWGIIIFLSMFLGIWWLWRYRLRDLVSFGSVLVLLLVASATWRYEAVRYLFPIWPLLVALGGSGIVYLSHILKELIHSARAGQLFVMGLTIAGVAVPLAASADEVYKNFLLPDTRNLAAEYILTNVPPGAFILREWNTPEIERISSAYRVHFTGYPFEEASLADWEQRGVTIVLLSSERYEFYSAHAVDFPDVLAEYDKLKSQGKLLRSFEPGATLKGPPEFIYAVP